MHSKLRKCSTISARNAAMGSGHSPRSYFHGLKSAPARAADRAWCDPYYERCWAPGLSSFLTIGRTHDESASKTHNNGVENSPWLGWTLQTSLLREETMISRLCALFTALLFAALFVTSFPASAGLWFTMVGGICTQSIPFTEECHNQHVTAQVQMVDGYVPGTPFFASVPRGDRSPIARLGVFNQIGSGVSRVMPIFSNVPPRVLLWRLQRGNPVGQSEVSIHWFDGFSF
jgi:hypothetical protein